jgi:hypothetical protein
MAAFAEAVKCVPSRREPFGGDRLDRDPDGLEQRVQIAATFRAELASMTIVASSVDATDMSRTASASIASAKTSASASPNKSATTAEVSITISAASHARRSR